MTEREIIIQRIEIILNYTHPNSITVTIPRLAAERAVSMLKEQEEQIKNRDEQIKKRDESLEKAREEIKWLRGMLKKQETIEGTIEETRG